MTLLEVEGLTVELATAAGPARVVDDIGFGLGRGESLGLVGESGCGKSITALALMGLLPEGMAARGRVVFDGRDLLALDEASLCCLRGRRIAMVFQEPMTALNPVRAIGDQVAESLRLHLRLGRAEAGARASAMLERVGLPERRFPRGLFPHQLSGGQRQRVVIAIALACGPDLLIADEPTTALDVTTQARILDLILELAAERGMALLTITHDLGVIAETTDRMLAMYAGRIVERGPTPEVFARLAHPYSRGLFAALPTAALEDAAPRGRLATIPGQVPGPLERPPGCHFAPRCPHVTPACRDDPLPWAEVGPGHQALCVHPQAGPRAGPRAGPIGGSGKP